MTVPERKPVRVAAPGSAAVAAPSWPPGGARRRAPRRGGAAPPLALRGLTASLPVALLLLVDSRCGSCKPPERAHVNPAAAPSRSEDRCGTLHDHATPRLLARQRHIPS
jgi:hypothetical protein